VGAGGCVTAGVGGAACGCVLLACWAAEEQSRAACAVEGASGVGKRRGGGACVCGECAGLRRVQNRAAGALAGSVFSGACIPHTPFLKGNCSPPPLAPPPTHIHHCITLTNTLLTSPLSIAPLDPPPHPTTPHHTPPHLHTQEVVEFLKDPANFSTQPNNHADWQAIAVDTVHTH